MTTMVPQTTTLKIECRNNFYEALVSSLTFTVNIPCPDCNLHLPTTDPPGLLSTMTYSIDGNVPQFNVAHFLNVVPLSTCCDPTALFVSETSVPAKIETPPLRSGSSWIVKLLPSINTCLEHTITLLLRFDFGSGGTAQRWMSLG